MSIQDYTIYCTKEQTRIAYELGAPIGITLNAYENGVQLASLCDNKYLWPVTTQQMIGWLREEKHINIVIGNVGSYFGYGIRRFENNLEDIIGSCECNMTQPQAELAAIDKALHYLLKKEE